MRFRELLGLWWSVVQYGLNEFRLGMAMISDSFKKKDDVKQKKIL
ncbi:MAG: hypothetical protein ABIH11_04145 [Candidatus Altiarchaeota archaeon]